MKKRLSYLLALCISFSTLVLPACTDSGLGKRGENVLRVASWDEYICEGGEDSYVENSRPLYEEFEDWYFEQTGQEITVEYVPLQDNETMYNKIKMGDDYDLLCPSEYMIMKLAKEGKLQKFPQEFFDTSVKTNYYAKNVSSYIKGVFDGLHIDEQSTLTDYAAGYMWGTTGFVFNRNEISPDIMTDWDAFTSSACERKITAKDNVRDSYFVGLGLYYQDELNALRDDLDRGNITLHDYQTTLSRMMNDTSETTMNAVKKKLIALRQNVYGLETDEGKLDVAYGRLDASYQWSGDAVYILDVADEREDESLDLAYTIPKSASNLWFDGWVMMDGIDEKTKNAAMAFVNFLSIPENVVRNMYYIGYTSCIGGDEVFDYVTETYGAEDSDKDTAEYDLSYFFGDGYTLTTPQEQTYKQLFAQYPPATDIHRLVVMTPFDKKTNERANRMWTNIK
ncbi:MAG: extracellular solute-binding protein [Clostridiales bacterium]|nr:extracellular solute-binding protein [Clostridiales bacterium]